MVHQNQRFAGDHSTGGHGFDGNIGKNNGGQGINDHGSQGQPPVLFKGGGHFSGNRANSDAVDIIKHAHFRHLPVAHEFGEDEKGNQGEK